MKFRSVFLGLIVCFLGLCFLTSPLFAQTFPTKAVTFIVPWPAGGKSDLAGRVLAHYIQEPLGQPVVVVNRPGASGVLGAKEVAMAKPDGYTLLLTSTGVVTAQYLVPTPSNLKEYEYVSLINLDPAAVIVYAESPFKNLQDLISYVKKNPGTIKLGQSPGTSVHVMNAIFTRAAGLYGKFHEIPYKGGGERNIALAGKHIDVDVDVVAVYKPLLEGGKVRILGVGSEKRMPLYKEFPTWKEQGVDCAIGSWNGIFAPKGTPEKILSIINNAIEKTFKNPKFVEAMNKGYMGEFYLNREEFTQFLEKEDARIKEVAKEIKQ